MRASWTLLGIAAMAACASGPKTQTADSSMTTNNSAAGTTDGSAMSGVAATSGSMGTSMGSSMGSSMATGTSMGGMAGMNGDPDRMAASGGGVPAGYMARTDRDGASIGGAKYVSSNGGWEVTTGPAHIVYATKDMGSGVYAATATFDQLEAPSHPEAYGIFIGGQNLDQPTQRYTYFIVRGTGEYAVKLRDGATARDVIAFRAAPGLAKADASGKATYKLTAHVAADSVHFLVNDKLVGAVAKSAVSTDGVAGIRINHNLHVRTSGVTITKG